MITVKDFIQPCNCRTVDECNHNTFVEFRALDALVDAYGKHAGLSAETQSLMKLKLHSKFARDGRTGWDDSASIPYLEESLACHKQKNDEIDVHNIEAFLWNLKSKQI